MIYVCIYLRKNKLNNEFDVKIKYTQEQYVITNSTNQF